MVVGIIAEYNPMHIGHLHHIAEAKRVSVADFVVCAMSGNFTQRGEPAILDKWTRAEIAVKNGADLVVEIPFCFATGSAQFFAKGGVEILEGLGFVDSICFGSESGNIDELARVAEKLNSDYIWKVIREKMASGISFAKAREAALGGDGDLLRNSNNILGVEYLRHITKLKAYTIPRKGFQFSEGALAIRQVLFEYGRIDEFADLLAAGVEDLIEEELFDILAMNDRYYDLVKAVIARQGDRLTPIFSAGEGLEMKVIKEFRHAKNLDELVEVCSGKRYARSRVKRFLLHSLVGLEKGFYKPYTRILAAGPQGRNLINTAKKAGKITIPILEKVGEAKGFGVEVEAEKDCIATDIYSIIRRRDLWENSEYVSIPRIL